MRALLVTGAKRLTALPEVPTAAEAGIPDLVVLAWSGFVVPTGTPPEVVATLQAAIARIVHSPEVRNQFEQHGVYAGGSTPEEFRRFIAEETAKWRRIIQVTGVKAQ